MIALKQFFVKGIAALSLICIATLAEAAGPVVVQNNFDSGFQSLRQAVIDVNRGTYDEIQFRVGLADIDLATSLQPFTVPVKISGIANLKISLNDTLENIIFNNASNGELYLSGNDTGGFSNWYGGISGSAGGVIRLEQQTSSTYLGVLNGSVSLIFQGVGQSLTLANASTYSGSTSIASGTVNVGFNNALPIGTTVDIALGGTLAIGNGFTQTLAGLTDNGSVNIGNAGILEIASIADSTFGGIMRGAGNFVKQGTGTFTLANSNIYTGSTEILEGTLKADSPTPNALPQTSPVTIGDAGTLEIAANRKQTLQSISGSGGILIDDAATLTVATVVDGNFAGNITTVGSGIFVKDGTNTLTLSGTNTGNLQLADAAGGIKIPTSGSWAGPVTIGAATLEMNGGTVTQGITGNGANTSILNITGVFTPSAAITDVGSINVSKSGTLFLTNDIVGAGGNVDNAGTVTHTANAVRTIAGNFTQAATGTINIGITNAQQYSQFQVDGHTTLNGGAINIGLLSRAAMMSGGVFDIITSTGGITNTLLPTVSKFSLSLSFRPIVNGNKLQLIASHTPYKLINNIPALDGVATGLDKLCASNPLHPLVGFVDCITSQSEFEGLLGQLAPHGLNGAYTAPGLGATDQILLRLDTMREMGTSAALARTGYIQTGYAAGDLLEDRGSFGPIVFGNSAKQSTLAGLFGYKALTAGFGFLGDAPILQYFRVGLGASYADSKVKQSNNTGSTTTIGSTQGMAYGSAAYGRLFLDAVLSAGINNYHGKRNIVMQGLTATSAYMGSQYSAKVKTGFTVPCYQTEISPTVALQYLHLNVDAYTEQGAASQNMASAATRINATRAYLGGKIANKCQAENFLPEIHAYYIVDLNNPNVLITSQFVSGGGTFVSTGPQAPKTGVNVGASITALLTENFVASGGYDFEGKKSFSSHSASLKFKFLF